MHWLLIDVSGLIGKPGAARKLTESGQVQDLKSGLGRVDVADSVQVDLTLTSTEGAIAVTGRVQGRLQLSCSRCLVEFGQDFALGLKEMFYLEPAAAEGNDGYDVGEDQTVNLEPMLRDAIVLNIPIKPVHSPECKGLCTICGADLNISDHSHDEEPVDVRWTVLQDLVKKGLIKDE